MDLTPEEERAITERAQRDANRALEVVIQRIEASGLKPTKTLVMAMIHEEFLPQATAQFEADIEAGRNIAPEPEAKSKRKFLGLF